MKSVRNCEPCLFSRRLTDHLFVRLDLGPGGASAARSSGLKRRRRVSVARAAVGSSSSEDDGSSASAATKEAFEDVLKKGSTEVMCSYLVCCGAQRMSDRAGGVAFSKSWRRVFSDVTEFTYAFLHHERETSELRRHVSVAHPRRRPPAQT